MTVCQLCDTTTSRSNPRVKNSDGKYKHIQERLDENGTRLALIAFNPICKACWTLMGEELKIWKYDAEKYAEFNPGDDSDDDASDSDDDASDSDDDASDSDDDASDSDDDAEPVEPVAPAAPAAPAAVPAAPAAVPAAPAAVPAAPAAVPAAPSAETLLYVQQQIDAGFLKRVTPKKAKAPRPVGQKRTKVPREETFMSFEKGVTQIEHCYKGHTAYATYVGNQNFKYVPGYPHSDAAYWIGKISGFCREHVDYLLDTGKIDTGSLAWNGWDACGLKGGKKGEW